MDLHFWRGRKVLLGITGSIAAASMPESVARLRLGAGVRVRIVTTPAASTFVTTTALAAASGGAVFTDSGGPSDLSVPHVQLAEWADLFMIMPATANVLAEAALGLAPNLLTTTLLAATCPIVFVPAMNGAMWSKPSVRRNVARLRSDGLDVLDPITGVSLGDSTVGVGSMASLEAVLRYVRDASLQRDHVDVGA